VVELLTHCGANETLLMMRAKPASTFFEGRIMLMFVTVVVNLNADE
jgi:hypothetical protein